MRYLWLCVEGAGRGHKNFQSPSGRTLSADSWEGTQVLPRPALQVPVWPGHCWPEGAHPPQQHGCLRSACSRQVGRMWGWPAWPSVPLLILHLGPQPAHGLWCQDCTLTTNSSHCTPKQCQPSDTVCASVRITDPSSSKSGRGPGWGEVGGPLSPSGLLCDSAQVPVLPWPLHGPFHVVG